MRTVEVSDALQKYMDGLVPPRDKVLARMEDEAHREDIPIVDTHEAQLLMVPCPRRRARRGCCRRCRRAVP